VSLDLRKERGVPLEKQQTDWKDLVQVPYSKLNDDAFTRVRVILMHGLEAEQQRFQHSMARMDRDFRKELALVRRVETFQQIQTNWLTPADQSPLETTLGYEQAAIEVTAEIARNEPDPYLAQVHRFGLLEDFDHLYRYAALYDRLLGLDPNYIVQSYSDIAPARPTRVHHRHPLDDLRRPYDRKSAAPLSKIQAYTIMASEHQTRDFYMNIGPMFADPVARQLYAEIAHVEEEHVTQYESIIDPDETWLEKWLLQQATEVYNYYSCYTYETHPRVKALWEKHLAWELGQMHFVADLFQRRENRDAFEVLPEKLPEPMKFSEHREWIRQVIRDETDLRPHGEDFRHLADTPDSPRSVAYRERLNAQGSPSDSVSGDYKWKPGTELVTEAQAARAAVEGRLQ
jgi:hypothetical protein